MLSPGTYEDPIYCMLVLSGDEHLRYDAVSYTWATQEGDSSKTHAVYIDDCVLKVTQNCYAALRQLRHPEIYRSEWIDAICINQLNVRERNHQVSMMDRIYRKAKQVHVCIKDDAHDYTEAINWLQLKDHRPMTTIEKAQLQMILRHRYFKRVWVIQEIVLAQRLILHVNTSRAVLTQYALLRIRITTEASSPLQLRADFDATPSLEGCLRLSLDCDCSDPRDRVYAILSLLKPSLRRLIPVDYSLTHNQVTQNVISAYRTIYQPKNSIEHRYAFKKPQSSSADALEVDEFMEFLQSPKLLYLGDSLSTESPFSEGLRLPVSGVLANEKQLPYFFSGNYTSTEYARLFYRRGTSHPAN